MSNKQDRLTKLESRWALAKEFGAIPLIGGTLGTAFAIFTDFMAAWAPYSWFAGAMVGALGFQSWSLLRSWQRERDESRRRIELLQAPKSQINPLDTEFRNQRIHLIDLLPPFGNTISGKEFRDCELVGPANLVLHASAPGTGELVECGFAQSDGVIADEGTVFNVVVLVDCRFRRCVFYSVTLVLPVAGYLYHRDRLVGLNWINSDSVTTLEKAGLLQQPLGTEEEKPQ